MLACLVVLMLTGMPIAFAFLLTCILGSVLFWGGLSGLGQLAMSVGNSVVMFSLLPVPLFLLMGNIIYCTGLGTMIVGALDKLLGRLPARLSVLAVAVGAVLGSMIGISGGSIAITATSLVPEMKRRGYRPEMTIGPIVSTGTLGTMIPPSALGVFLAAMGGISAAKVLVGIIVPGLLLAVAFAVYILVRVALKPDLAPAYEVERVPLQEKLRVLVRELLPFLLIIFSVLGVIFLGICTPSEAAAFGAIACYVLAAAYRRLTWQAVKESAVATIEITAMILVITMGAMSFSRILASSGAVNGFIHWITDAQLSPWLVLIGTQAIIMVLGCFMEPASIVMLTVPVFIPLMSALGFDPIWYAVIMLLNIQLGLITPPLGLDVYNAKSVVSRLDPDITVEDVFRSSMPFFFIGVLVMVLLMIFPQLVLWLPSAAK
jgi:tripartite ATP-independent transporter DctM subunit